ncbi:cytoskeleton protein RodZ [Gammaproteobacteria bacterium]
MNTQLLDNSFENTVEKSNSTTLDTASALLMNAPLEGKEGKKMENADPGSLLRRAREERRQTQAEIAAMLRLNVNVITALEENNYAHLPLPTFVRGYLRSYAKLLDMAPEPIIAAYERQGVITQPPVTLFIRNQSSNDRIWHFFSYVVIAGLIALVAIWWRSDPPANVKNTVVEQTVSPQTPEVKHGSTPQDKSLAAQLSRELAEIVGAGPPPEDASTSPTHTPTTEVAATTPTPASDAAPVSTDTSVSSTGAAIVPSTPAAPVEANTQSLAASTTPSSDAQSTVTVRATVKTWIKIQDHKDKKLFNDFIKAGQSKTIQGKPPFKVHLKRTKGVTIDYNGQPFDFHSYIKDKSADFLLDKKP